MAKRTRHTSLQKFVETVAKILKKADEQKQDHSTTACELVSLVENEMLTMQKALRNNTDLLYGDNADEYITRYILRHYRIKP